MANTANASYRSRLVKNDSARIAPKGLPHNVGDFSHLSRQQTTSRQDFLRKNWDYLPAKLVRKAVAMSTAFKGVPLDPKDDRQFALGF